MTLPAWIRAMLGLRTTTIVDGVRYTELTSEPLARALSRRGSRMKEYAVAFPLGRKMRIHITPERLFADLTPSRLLQRYKPAEPFIRPGQRVLICRAGTGDVPAWIATLVGPSGAVVALDTDDESTRYARWRYAVPNIAFETGFLEALTGETDGAFDGVALADLPPVQQSTEDVIREFWRLVAPGGWLMLANLPSPNPTTADPPPIDSPTSLLARVCIPRHDLTTTSQAAIAHRSPREPT